MKKILMLALTAFAFNAQAESLTEFNQKMDKEIQEFVTANKDKLEKEPSLLVKTVVSKYRENEKPFLEALKSTCTTEKWGDEKACGCLVEKSNHKEAWDLMEKLSTKDPNKMSKEEQEKFKAEADKMQETGEKNAKDCGIDLSKSNSFLATSSKGGEAPAKEEAKADAKAEAPAADAKADAKSEAPAADAKADAKAEEKADDKAAEKK